MGALFTHEPLAGLVVQTRCGVPEVFHNGLICTASPDGKIEGAGDVDVSVPLRSTAKPFFLGALLDTILRDEAFEDQELALMSSSHNGEPAHEQLLKSLLGRYSLSTDQLRCGAHPPFRSNSVSGAAGNNCSGKHALFMIAAKIAGWPIDDYLNPAAPMHRVARDGLAHVLATDELLAGIDGCSLPTYAVPLRNIALGFARWSSDLLGASYERVRRAHLKASFYVGGTDRLESHLIGNHGLSVKSGSDGLWALGVPQARLGVVAKVFSGSEAAVQLAILEFLISTSMPQLRDDSYVADYCDRPCLNWAGIATGELKACLPELRTI